MNHSIVSKNNSQCQQQEQHVPSLSNSAQLDDKIKLPPLISPKELYKNIMKKIGSTQPSLKMKLKHDIQNKYQKHISLLQSHHRREQRFEKSSKSMRQKQQRHKQKIKAQIAQRAEKSRQSRTSQLNKKRKKMADSLQMWQNTVERNSLIYNQKLKDSESVIRKWNQKCQQSKQKKQSRLSSISLILSERSRIVQNKTQKHLKSEQERLQKALLNPQLNHNILSNKAIKHPKVSKNVDKDGHIYNDDNSYQKKSNMISSTTNNNNNSPNSNIQLINKNKYSSLNGPTPKVKRPSMSISVVSKEHIFHSSAIDNSSPKQQHTLVGNTSSTLIRHSYTGSSNVKLPALSLSSKKQPIAEDMSSQGNNKYTIISSPSQLKNVNQQPQRKYNRRILLSGSTSSSGLSPKNHYQSQQSQGSSCSIMQGYLASVISKQSKIQKARQRKGKIMSEIKLNHNKKEQHLDSLHRQNIESIQSKRRQMQQKLDKKYKSNRNSAIKPIYQTFLTSNNQDDDYYEQPSKGQRKHIISNSLSNKKYKQSAITQTGGRSRISYNQSPTQNQNKINRSSLPSINSTVASRYVPCMNKMSQNGSKKNHISQNNNSYLQKEEQKNIVSVDSGENMLQYGSADNMTAMGANTNKKLSIEHQKKKKFFSRVIHPSYDKLINQELRNISIVCKNQRNKIK